MYSLIAYYIAFKMIDLTIEGFGESKSVWINQATAFGTSGTPSFSGLAAALRISAAREDLRAMTSRLSFCVVTRLEEAKLKSIVEEIDPTAFLAGRQHSRCEGRTL